MMMWVMGSLGRIGLSMTRVLAGVMMVVAVVVGRRLV
jgi:hypothetical protein